MKQPTSPLSIVPLARRLSEHPQLEVIIQFARELARRRQHTAVTRDPQPRRKRRRRRTKEQIAADNAKLAAKLSATAAAGPPPKKAGPPKGKERTIPSGLPATHVDAPTPELSPGLASMMGLGKQKEIS